MIIKEYLDCWTNSSHQNLWKCRENNKEDAFTNIQEAIWKCPKPESLQNTEGFINTQSVDSTINYDCFLFENINEWKIWPWFHWSCPQPILCFAGLHNTKSKILLIFQFSCLSPDLCSQFPHIYPQMPNQCEKTMIQIDRIMQIDNFWAGSRGLIGYKKWFASERSTANRFRRLTPLLTF